MVVGCMTLLSCSKEETIGKVDSMIDVRLSLTLSGTAYTRDVDNKDAALDYTTDNQNKINDLYILLIDKNGKFQYLVDELLVQNTEKTLYKGTIQRPAAGSKLVLLANINQQNLSGTSDVTTWLNTFKGQAVKNIYDNAVFSNATGNWDLTSRSIPMWGEAEIGTPVEGNVTLSCNLYKALAKVNIWVNEKRGLDGFEITKIVVKNSLDRGYCVSQSPLFSDLAIQYEEPYVPTMAANRTADAEYTNLSVTDAYSDKIYVVEQINNSETLSPITVEVHYTLYGEAGVGTINFKDENGVAFNVTRNHSYIFNISKVSGTNTNVSLVYDVVDYYDIHQINIGFN